MTLSDGIIRARFWELVYEEFKPELSTTRRTKMRGGSLSARFSNCDVMAISASFSTAGLEPISTLQTACARILDRFL